MTNYVLDTSFLQSLFNINDLNNSEAERVVMNFEEERRFYIPQIVIAELAIGVEGINIINKCKILTPRFEKSNMNDIDFILKIPYPKRKTLKANDCLVIALCKRVSGKLITFDKKLEKHANELF